MIPSINQQAVYDTWTSTESNILIQAVAGGAKTTTLMGVLERCDDKTLFLAFNKSIKEEIENRIINGQHHHGKAMTLHSLGLRAIKAHYGFKNVYVNSSKNWEMLKYLQKLNRKAYSKMGMEDGIKTNFTLLDMNEVSRLFFTNDVDEIFSYMLDMDKYYFEDECLRDLWEQFLEIREESYQGKVELDFTDMIYLVVKNNIKIPIDPVYLMIDECQDLNIIQHKFINLFINQGDVKKWIAVGDKNQSIYGFSGAYGASFDLFKSKDNVIELPLDVCYRCPTKIIDEANSIYDVMESYKEDEGIVETIIDSSLIKKGSMVICRNSGPLFNLYFELLAQDKKVYIKGEDILNSMIRFLKPYSNSSVSTAKSRIGTEMNRLTKKVDMSDSERFKLFKLKENYKNFNLLTLKVQLETEKVSNVINFLNGMFSEVSDENVIMLCTIHKSKGLEADVVYILNEFLIPSKFAKSPIQLEQEQNLKYVARTRAKKEMYYLNIESDD